MKGLSNHWQKKGLGLKALAVVMALLIGFGVALLIKIFYQPSAPDLNPPAIVYISEDYDLPPEAGSEDAIGDFILHHEYFAADQDVLQDAVDDEVLPEQENSTADEKKTGVDFSAPIESLPTTEDPNLFVADAPKKIILNNIDFSAPIESLQTTDDPNLFVADVQKRIILNNIDVAKPLVAVVIDDMGINQKRTKEIISLQAPLTVSFLTYGRDLAELAALSRKSGHEIMIHAPMEPKVKANLAPDTLMVDMDKTQIEEMFDGMLEKFADIHISGINNHMGSKFTEDKEKLGLIMEILKKRNMFFLDSKTTASSKGKELAQEDGVDYAGRDVFLDNENDYDYIMGQLIKTEKIAAKKGFAIAICHPKSQTYHALRDWLEKLEDKPIKLVHVSEIVKAINQQASN